MTTESASPAPGTGPAPATARVVPALVDAAIVAVWFVVAGLVGGWVWAQVTSLPQVTKHGNNATVSADELVKQVAMDGWFFVIAVVGGLLSGVVLLAWRHRDPLLSVALVASGAGLASWLMLRTGDALGPGEPVAALRRLPDGAHVSEQLHLHAHGVVWAWPIAAAFGTLLHLWVFSKPGAEPRTTDTLQ
jgi:hypothetical protein